jgi:hypothetical protein
VGPTRQSLFAASRPVSNDSPTGIARRDDPELSALFEVRINGLPRTAEISDVVMSRVDSLCDLASVCAQAVYFCRSLSSN